MKIDTFIKGGANHNMCEDYILSGTLPIPYIIISDGCSSSSNTETGARILSHLAKQYLKYRADYLEDLDKNEMGDWIAHNAEMVARQLGLPTSCLDATLIVALMNEIEVTIHMFGDGFIYGISKDEERIKTHLDEVIYTNNAPYYLSYRIDPERDELYHEMHNDVSLVTNYKGGGQDSYSFAYDSPLTISLSRSLFKTIIVSSDGLGSFILPDSKGQIKKDPMELMNVHFSTFKNTTGEFLKRRCARAIQRFEKSGVIHFDDFSMGAFILEE